MIFRSSPIFVYQCMKEMQVIEKHCKGIIQKVTYLEHLLYLLRHKKESIDYSDQLSHLLFQTHYPKVRTINNASKGLSNGLWFFSPLEANEKPLVYTLICRAQIQYKGKESLKTIIINPYECNQDIDAFCQAFMCEYPLDNYLLQYYQFQIKSILMGSRFITRVFNVTLEPFINSYDLIREIWNSIGYETFDSLEHLKNLNKQSAMITFWRMLFQLKDYEGSTAILINGKEYNRHDIESLQQLLFDTKNQWDVPGKFIYDQELVQAAFIPVSESISYSTRIK
jgi:hypothetical protein